uniref:CSN8_PSD8_EIF3K domain-containing protein n=1 Tax=Macrostomum lignano TaxID=282301 RepID=A0A1I8JNL8_9PLAT
YQFNPSHYQTNVTIKILLKAIANLPHPDFSLCKYLIEPDKLREEPLSSVVALGNQLETCDFEEFWQNLASTKSSIPAIGSVMGFTDSVRKFICHVVGISYQKIKTDQLCRILDIKRDQLAVYLEEYGWKLVPDDPSHVFVFNYEETIKTRNISEKIGFPQVKQLAPVLQNAASDCHKRANIYLLEVARLKPAYVSVISFSRTGVGRRDGRPLIGLLLSCTNTRFGKTRPWILGSSLCGSLPVSVHVVAVAAAETQAGKFAYYLLMQPGVSAPSRQ